MLQNKWRYAKKRKKYKNEKERRRGSRERNTKIVDSICAFFGQLQFQIFCKNSNGVGGGLYAIFVERKATISSILWKKYHLTEYFFLHFFWNFVSTFSFLIYSRTHLRYPRFKKSSELLFWHRAKFLPYKIVNVK